MYECLAQHPEVFVPEKKEIHYFGTDLYSPSYLRDRDSYLSLFYPVRDEKRIGEASVWYLYSQRSAEEIKEFNPAANIIIMLRNPVDMIYSLHSHLLFIGTEEIEDFAEALDAEADRKIGLRLPKNPFPIPALFYRETAKYSAQVERYIKTFGREKVLVITYDDFKNDTAGNYRDTFSFLGVDSQFMPEIKIVNPNKKVRSKWVRELLDNPGPTAFRRVGRPLMSRHLRHRLFKLARRWNTNFVQRPPLREELRRQLQAEFAPDMTRLSDILRRDLTHWCQASHR
jgi:hypothetical protein